MGFRPGDIPIVAPATDAAKQWDGWGTALKPAMEDWWLLRKPLSEKTVAANVQKWGCGCIHIDASRIPVSDTRSGGFGKGHRPWTKGDIGNNTTYEDKQGRWPANLIHDGSEEVLELFPETTTCGGEKKTTHDAGMFGIGQPGRVYNKSDGENKSAARFFKSFPLRERTATGICQASRLKYCSKASRAEREAGCEGMEERDVLGAVGMPIVNNGRGPEYLSHGKEYERKGKAKNHHPTVKPLALMRYLVRLVTPPNGTILDPFMGSGTTGMAAKAEGFEFIGIEKDLEYVAIAERRIEATA
jgi:site-specific DNA-methyltransferase (adenine-specific)